MWHVKKYIYIISVILLMLSVLNCSNEPEFQTTDRASTSQSQPGENPAAAQDSEYLTTCNELKNAMLPTISSGDSFIKSHGEGEFAFNQIEKIEKVRGNFSFVGIGENPLINRINKYRGQMLICFADIGDISHFNGNLIIVGGEIKGHIRHSRRSHIVTN